MSESAPETLYDLVEYRARPRGATHPDRLATLARLFGLSVAHPARCRVLELGCSDGGNLLSMAVALPESRFLGLDYASSAIEEGRELIREVGVSNVELRVGDVTKLDASLGEFDFVIAHGIYSWVPEPVRESILGLIRATLAPNGVAFVSYNAYPGGFARQMARQMMLFHVEGVEDPEQRITQALEFLAHVVTRQPVGQVSRVMLEQELKQLARAGTSFVFHDALAEENRSFLFREFMTEATAHGLAFLSESQFFESYEASEHTGFSRNVPPEANLDVLRREQYLDFLKGRSFRQTLLVHAGRVIDRSVSPERVVGLYAQGQLTRVADFVSEEDQALEQFRSPEGTLITTASPLAKRIFPALAASFPVALSFDELLALAGDAAGDARRDLCEILLGAYAAGGVELTILPSAFRRQPAERPLVSPLARAQAKGPGFLSTLRHQAIALEAPVERALLTLLDGTRTRAELAEPLRETLAASGALALLAPDALTPETIERVLIGLGRLAFYMP